MGVGPAQINQWQPGPRIEYGADSARPTRGMVPGLQATGDGTAIPYSKGNVANMATADVYPVKALSIKVDKALMPQASSSSLARRPKGTATAVPFSLRLAPGRAGQLRCHKTGTPPA